MSRPLADDERGRVPFALLAVVLLLGSTAYGASLATRGPVAADRAVEATLERATTTLRPTVRTAASDAFRRAARRPVTTPADTEFGAALDPETAFRDALRIRVYVSVARALDGRRLAERVDGTNAGATPAAGGTGERTTVTASLPAVDDADDLRAAKRSVTVERFTNDTGARVTVENVSLTVTRAGTVVARENRNVTVDVGVPTLALHERTELFQRRLDRGPLAGPGVGRFATAELTLYAWARGYRQWGGEPIANVVGTRHVAAAINSAVLREQRLAFGRTDPAGKRAMAVALARTVARDYAAPRGSEATARTAELLSEAAAREAVDAPPLSATRRDAVGGDPRRGNVTVGVNGSADEALVGLLDDGGLADLARDGYRAEARLTVSVRPTKAVGRPQLRPPATNWTLLGRERSRTVRVDGGECRDVRFTDCYRFVAVEHTETRRWRAPDDLVGGREPRTRTRTRTVEWTHRYRVRVRTTARYAPQRPAPNRSVDPLYRRGGALDGPNLADVPTTVRDRLVADAGGVDALATAAVTDGELSRTAVVHGERPDELRSAVAADLAGLRERVRRISVDVSRRAVARGDAVPAATLAATLRQRRAALLDAPATYDGAAERTIVAARLAYLRELDRVLRERAEATERARSGGGLFDSELTGRRAAVGLAADSESDWTATSESGFRPRGTPAYLTVSPLTVTRGGNATPTEYHPLVTRNVNVAAVPYGDAADAVVDAVFGGQHRVGPGAAGRTLGAASDAVRTQRSLDGEANASLRARRDRLRNRLNRTLRRYRYCASSVLAAETDLPRRDRRAVVGEAFSRWPTTAGRAKAAANGTLADAVAERAVARGVQSASAPWLTSRLRVAFRELTATDAGRVAATPVSETATKSRRVGRRLLKRAATDAARRASKRAAERVVGRSLSRLPAGVPLAPPYGWYATVNGWSVSVRGEYRTFAVSARYGAPDGAGGVVRYVRDGSPVSFDVDGDGDGERIGRSERVGFAFETAVVVAVPAGGTGVGDVGGDVDERSDGWPCPGSRRDDGCRSSDTD
ncbi:MAG: hypothetical protein ABEJ79_10205 [Halolamina sp.]